MFRAVIPAEKGTHNRKIGSGSTPGAPNNVKGFMTHYTRYAMTKKCLVVVANFTNPMDGGDIQKL